MLSRPYRIVQKKEIEMVLRRGQCFYGRATFCKILKNNTNTPRFVFIVSNKVSKSAVIRNGIKRRLREAIRARLPKIRTGYNCAIFAKRQLADLNFLEINQEIEALFNRAGLLKKGI